MSQMSLTDVLDVQVRPEGGRPSRWVVSYPDGTLMIFYRHPSGYGRCGFFPVDRDGSQIDDAGVDWIVNRPHPSGYDEPEAPITAPKPGEDRPF